MRHATVDRHSRAPIGLIVAAAILFVAIRVPFVSVPLERDEGEYAYIAQRMLAGDVAYRDAFDQKPPAIFVVYALAFLSFGQTIEAIHLALYLWTALAAAVLFRLVRELAGALAAGFALLVFAIASADPQLQGHAANTENFMLLPLLLAAWACVRGWRDGARASWFACGAFAVLACWFKPVAVTNALLLAAGVLGDPIVGRTAPGRREIARRAGWLALGAALAFAPVPIYFAAVGALAPFVDAVFVHNFAYVQSSSPAEGLANLGRTLARQAPSSAPFWALALFGWLAPGAADVRVRGALAAWWLCSLAGAAFGLQFRPHYFLQALPALAALAGVGAAGVVERLAARGPAARRSVAIGLAVLLAALPLFALREFLLAGSPAAIARRLYGLNPFPESIGIARYIERTSLPDDRVYIVGSEPQILFYAARRSATRYIFFYPLTGDFPDARARQQEVIDAVQAARPLYIVWAEIPTSLLRMPSSEPFVFDATTELLKREYRLEFVVRPTEDFAAYAFDYGSQALAWVRGAREKWGTLPWIAVYRRAR